MPAFDLGYTEMLSLGKIPENVWKRSWKSLEIYFQNFVETLHQRYGIDVTLTDPVCFMSHDCYMYSKTYTS